MAKFIFRLFAISFLLISWSVIGAEETPKDMQIFLLIGQSNMAGRGKVEPQDEVTNPHIFMMNKEKAWTLAKAPLHFDKPIAGVGPGLQFARTILSKRPGITIGLIPAAVGGTSMGRWQPGKDLYANAVERVKEAEKSGKLAGILWHQGEWDLDPKAQARYLESFRNLITSLRRDLHAEHVPVIIGELGYFVKKGDVAAFNANIPNVANSVPLCTYVKADGLEDRGDSLHFNSPSARKLGERYAEAYLLMAK